MKKLLVTKYQILCDALSVLKISEMCFKNSEQLFTEKHL